MDRRVVVIAFVICLDLAFILLMRGSGETVDALKPIPPPTVEPVNIPLETEVAETTNDVSPRTIAARKNRDLARIARRPETVHNFPTARRAASRARRTPAVPAAEFKDTIIWIQPAAYVRAEQPSRRPVTSSSREKPHSVLYAKKKRSIFSRTVPVVKKPYQWLKALALKLT
jgi:hypothetical protein